MADASIFREAAQYIDEHIEFSAWIQRIDGLCMPLDVHLARVGSFPGLPPTATSNPRALLEMSIPEVACGWFAEPLIDQLPTGPGVPYVGRDSVAPEDGLPLQTKSQVTVASHWQGITVRWQ